MHSSFLDCLDERVAAHDLPGSGEAGRVVWSFLWTELQRSEHTGYAILVYAQPRIVGHDVKHGFYVERTYRLEKRRHHQRAARKERACLILDDVAQQRPANFRWHRLRYGELVHRSKQVLAPSLFLGKVKRERLVATGPAHELETTGVATQVEHGRCQRRDPYLAPAVAEKLAFHGAGFVLGAGDDRDGSLCCRSLRVCIPADCQNGKSGGERSESVFQCMNASFHRLLSGAVIVSNRSSGAESTQIRDHRASRAWTVELPHRGSRREVGPRTPCFSKEQLGMAGDDVVGQLTYVLIPEPLVQTPRAGVER